MFSFQQYESTFFLTDMYSVHCTHREDKSRFKWIELHMYIECVCGRTHNVVTIYGMAREKHFICKEKNQFVLTHKNF